MGRRRKLTLAPATLAKLTISQDQKGAVSEVTDQLDPKLARKKLSAIVASVADSCSRPIHIHGKEPKGKFWACSDEEYDEEDISTPELIAEAHAAGFILNDLHHAEAELMVLFRGTYWLRLWAKLQRSEECKHGLLQACRKLETVAMQLFSSFGWSNS
ncbi:hypothetical protein U9M48_037704 [Paspalum notatum var. saurae]|uniref:Uncharacterized protein n=1 Tax=Paspalum notatum var. saurae TaxID=547442 RepID=A0AAQ3X9L2_PASNO